MSTGPDSDRIFKALADHRRRAILDELKEEPKTTGMLCGIFPELHRCTVMQHLGVLEEAELIVFERRGRERWNHLNAMPIKRIHDRWIGDYAKHAVARIDTLKRALEKN